MAQASPERSDPLRLCLSDSEEEDLFGAGDSKLPHPGQFRPCSQTADDNWKENPPRTTTAADDVVQEEREATDLDDHAVLHRHNTLVRSISENVSSARSLLDRNNPTFPTKHGDGQVRSPQSGSSQRLHRASSADRGVPEPPPDLRPGETLSQKKHVRKLERQRSLIDGLLMEIYDRSPTGRRLRADSADSDTLTECSSVCDTPPARPGGDGRHDPGTALQQSVGGTRYNRHNLQHCSVESVRGVVQQLQHSVTHTSARLVRQLKRRERREARMWRHCQVLTAILQAASLKRQVDTRMKFSVVPPSGPSAFDQWKDAMKAVNRLPLGIPPQFRKKVWLSLADHYVRQLKIDWSHTVRLAFNDRSNPDDDKLGLQIVKDLHRTGCSRFSGQDNEEERAVLKRVLLAYARWNKGIGYCQGFNVLVTVLLDVTDRREEDALKVMIYLIDRVLPEGYFDHNLRALSVDMAVFRDLLRLTLPSLASHLDSLQQAAQDTHTGGCYEPPVLNVFVMQWLLTLFATCLPKDLVLRVWDTLLLEGSEILLRTALCLWTQLARRIMTVESADEFYCLMGELSKDMMEGAVYDSDGIVEAIYAVAPFPFPQLTELREKYTYNIRPFSSAPTPTAPGGGGGGGGGGGRLSRLARAVWYSDEEEPDEEELRAMAALPALSPPPGARGKSTDISVVGPGVFGAEGEAGWGGRDTVYLERMSTDLTALKMQYDRLRQRQRQAHVISAAAVSAKKAVELKQKRQAPVLVPKMDSPLAMNHLFVGKVQGRNRMVTKGPCLPDSPSPANTALTKHVHAQTSPGSISSAPYPVGTTTVSSSCPAKEAAVKSKRCITDRMEDTLQVCDKDKQSRHLSSSECTHDNGACTAPKSLCTVTHSRSDGQSARHEKEYRMFESSETKTCMSYSVCVESSGESKAGFSTPVEDRTDDLENGDDRLFPQTQLSGSGNRQSTAQREDKTVLDANDRTANHRGDLRYANSTLSEDFSRVVLTVPKHKQHNNRDQNVNTVCEKVVTHTNIDVVEKVCGQAHDLQHTVISRSLSEPVSSPSSPNKTPLSSASTPTHSQPGSLCPVPSLRGGLTARRLSSPSVSPCDRAPRPFNPFPVKHVNTNRARTGLRLGLYTPSTLRHIQGQLMGAVGGTNKASHASS